ncbi:MAG: hypothetical protein AAGD96_02385 [Chloroflexota bacterium]
MYKVTKVSAQPMKNINIIEFPLIFRLQKCKDCHKNRLPILAHCQMLFERFYFTMMSSNRALMLENKEYKAMQYNQYELTPLFSQEQSRSVIRDMKIEHNRQERDGSIFTENEKSIRVFAQVGIATAILATLIISMLIM